MNLKSRRSIPAGAGGATTTLTLPASTWTATGPASTTVSAAFGTAPGGAVSSGWLGGFALPRCTGFLAVVMRRRGAGLLRSRGRLGALSPRLPSHHSKLKYASRSECENDHGPEKQGEQQRHREREVAFEHQKRDLDALLVLEDEDQDHHQSDKADNNGGPCAAEARLPLARQRFAFGRFGSRLRGIVHLSRRYYLKCGRASQERIMKTR